MKTVKKIVSILLLAIVIGAASDRCVGLPDV